MMLYYIKSTGTLKVYFCFPLIIFQIFHLLRLSMEHHEQYSLQLITRLAFISSSDNYGRVSYSHCESTKIKCGLSCG